MIASPNYIIGIYNASETPEQVRGSSKIIQIMFHDHFRELAMESELVTFDGVSGFSDSDPFVFTASIPAGGVTVRAFPPPPSLHTHTISIVLFLTFFPLFLLTGRRRGPQDN